MPTIWPRLLERLSSGDPVVGIDEFRRWGRLEFERAVGLGIMRETEAATRIMCDACPERHSSEVICVGGLLSRSRRDQLQKWKRCGR